jgi:hypothetical protein
MHLNGNKVGDQVLTPGWTSYGKRIQYQTFDVTGMLVIGKNAIGAVLGDGWYRGKIGYGNFWPIYGKTLGLLLQLKIIFTDGSEIMIASDETWKAINDGAIRMNDIYNGETFDATKILTGWDLSGYNDKDWFAVKIGNHLSTGFIGTPYLCHVLSDNGYTDVAYDLLLQESYPSWLYPVKMGATTIWERWDGQKTDSTFQDPHMNSFNHYAYGAIGDWMYRVSAGIEAGSPGYKHIVIQPHLTKKLTYSRASFESSTGQLLPDGKGRME